MVDTSKIHKLITKARGRLRRQAAAEAATTASILAFAAALAVIYAVRRDAIGEGTGIMLLVACGAIVVVGAVVGAVKRFPTHVVATRIDRASLLSDRLSSACAFERTLVDADDDKTAAFMRAAINDAVKAVPRANIKAATPYSVPRDLRPAIAFGLVAALVAGLYWPKGSIAGPIDGPDQIVELPSERTDNPDEFEEEDLDYARELLDDLRRTSKLDREPNLEKFVEQVETLLAKAELGELTKEQLLEELAKAEQKFMEGAEENIEESLSDLKETGKELSKNQMTKDLGKALAQGDLEKAQQEFEKLAEKLDNNELSEKDQQKLAKALEKAADKFQNKQDKREQRMDKQIANKKKQLQKLQRKHDQAKNENDKRRLAERMKKKKRELKKLERKKQEQQQSAQKRTLKQLHRNMKQASKQLQKNKQTQQGQKKQKNKRMASRNLRNASRDTGKVNADKRKIAAQKKVASQLGDLKEAMRRARRRGRKGQRDLFGKNRRNQDFRRRARGQRGQRNVWRPGQGKGKPGKQGQQSNKPGGKGKQGGQSYGDQHDPYLMGDSTAKSGNTKDKSVSGVHGKGPSRRETILSAAQKGFSSQSYKKVYADYKDIVEEVMRTEKVPSGYKYYIKRYFQKIKPHTMN